LRSWEILLVVVVGIDVAVVTAAVVGEGESYATLMAYRDNDNTLKFGTRRYT